MPGAPYHVDLSASYDARAKTPLHMCLSDMCEKTTLPAVRSQPLRVQSETIPGHMESPADGELKYGQPYGRGPPQPPYMDVVMDH